MSNSSATRLQVKRCAACSEFFQPRSGWEWLCYPCWRVRKDRDLEGENARLRRRLELANNEILRRSGSGDLHAELLIRLPRLLQLVHPDKHAGSRAANELTAWLLSLRGRP